MTTLTETIHDAAFLVSEEENYYSRDKIVVASGAGKLVAGAVLGRKVVSGVSASAVKASGANTGNGTLVLDATTPILANATVGVYTVRCIVAGANAATFRVTDPAGRVLGDVAFSGSGASGTFADHIKFAVADGSTDFIVGDGFDVSVSDIVFKYVAAPDVAADGSDVAQGVLYAAVDATSADQQAVIVNRLAQVRATDLSYDASVTTAAQIAKKANQLLARGVIVR